MLLLGPDDRKNRVSTSSHVFYLQTKIMEEIKVPGYHFSFVAKVIALGPYFHHNLVWRGEDPWTDRMKVTGTADEKYRKEISFYVSFDFFSIFLIRFLVSLLLSVHGQA